MSPFSKVLRKNEKKIWVEQNQILFLIQMSNIKIVGRYYESVRQ